MARMNRSQIVLFACVAPAALVMTSLGADSRSFVIRNARVFTLSPAGTLERATVVIQEGKIAAVGANPRIPAGAQVIEGKGLQVYPGMINSWSNIGLAEIGAVDVTVDSREQGDYKPQLLAFSAIHPASEHIPVARANGVTTSLSVPSGGVIAGQAALVHLDGWTADEMAILKSAGMVVTFPSLGAPPAAGRPGPGRGARQPFSELKRNYQNRVKELSEWLERARHYAKARQSNPATPVDRQLEALGPVVEGRATMFLMARYARDIRNALEFASKEKLRMVLVTGPEAVQVAGLLKKDNVPVILGPVISLPEREDDPYDAAFTAPRDLAKAGVKFAIVTPSSSDTRNLPYEAGFAQAFGLSHEDALRSITLSPAEILGVADKIGSVEAGKVADLVVTDGDLLEMRTQVKHVFIAGRPASLETRQTKLYEKYLSRP